MSSADEKARRKNIAIFLVIAVTVMGLLSYFVYTESKKYNPPKVEAPVIDTKSSKTLEQSWMASKGMDVEKTTKRVEELEKQIEGLKKQNEALKAAQTGMPPGTPPLPPTVPRQTSIKKSEKIENIVTQDPAPAPHLPPPPPPPQYVAPPTPKEEPKPIVLENLIIFGKVETDSTKSTKKEENQQQAKDAKKNKKHIIPTGTYVKGALLSGVDAPTGTRGQGQPHPTLIRIINKAILPNKWKSNIKDCVVVGDAYGELSSERAYIRTHTLSCVTDSGNIIEKKISGYVTGEDGKVGLSGRPVSKQGLILARAVLAGFLEGWSNIFKQQSMMTSFSAFGSTQTMDSAKASENAIYSGLGEAAKRLSDFYIKLINEQFPVIEINAGRRVEIVFLSKVEFEQEEDTANTDK